MMLIEQWLLKYSLTNSVLDSKTHSIVNKIDPTKKLNG